MRFAWIAPVKINSNALCRIIHSHQFPVTQVPESTKQLLSNLFTPIMVSIANVVGILGIRNPLITTVPGEDLRLMVAANRYFAGGGVEEDYENCF